MVKYVKEVKDRFFDLFDLCDSFDLPLLNYLSTKVNNKTHGRVFEINIFLYNILILSRIFITKPIVYEIYTLCSIDWSYCPVWF
jgi:hypothetical protein